MQNNNVKSVSIVRTDNCRHLHETRGGKYVYSSGPMIGKAYNHHYSVIGFITFTTSDIPAKQKVSIVK
jgi:hypothetical protein